MRLQYARLCGVQDDFEGGTPAMNVRTLRFGVFVFGAWCLAGGIFERSWPAVALGQGTSSNAAANQLLAALQDLYSEMQSLQAQLGGAKGFDQRRVGYEEYRASFLKNKERIERCRERLSDCYQRIDKLYRVDPRGREYQQARKAYLDTTALFEKVEASVKVAPPPEKIRVQAVLSPDKRLGQRLSDLGGNAAAPAAEAARDLRQSDALQFIGVFDGVEMFLLTKEKAACYVFFGWKEKTAEKGEKEKIRASVARSEFFTAKDAQTAAPAAHLERALGLKITMLDAKGEDWGVINECLARVKSYAVYHSQ
jgi:hypothetical protein